MAKLKKAKSDPKIAYVYHPVNGEQCSKCVMFRSPDECTDVSGDISPKGWCKIWSKK
jgi:hypothetical protein